MRGAPRLSFIYLSPSGFLFCGYGAGATSPTGEQGLCQAHNKLIALAFPIFRRIRADPHGSKFDAVIVPRRNTPATTATDNEEFLFVAI
jgi:hypothetical protein